MNNRISVLLISCLVSLLSSQTLIAQTVLPTDPQTSNCSISDTAFKQWFVNTPITANGSVNPANSVGFPTDNNACDFYKWSSQMFLWLTSPSASGGGDFVFDSTTFFDVSPEDGNGKRQLISNDNLNSFVLRSAKSEEIGETGQAGGGGVLMSQGESLVYYGIHVNDVYAYFLTGLKNTAITADVFPNSKANLDVIEQYVSTLEGVTLPDANALTLELKTAWVDAATVSDVSQYITIKAEVPKYTPLLPPLFFLGKTGLIREWELTGTEQLTLVLVGMHVVGSVNGHPEMVWATFEHINNAPDNNYIYTNNKDQPSIVDYSSTGDWLFMETGGEVSSANVERMALDKLGNIVAQPKQTIGASNSYRVNPWGSAPSKEDSADNNAQIISLNNDVMGFLSSGDVRKNYFLSGALWTQHGNIPFFTDSGTGIAFTEEGSLSLANTTMETYHQETAKNDTTATGCFSCHSIGGSNSGLEVSHIFDDIQPLTVIKIKVE